MINYMSTLVTFVMWILTYCGQYCLQHNVDIDHNIMWILTANVDIVSGFVGIESGFVVDVLRIESGFVED